jgi:hypothetical protein
MEAGKAADIGSAKAQADSTNHIQITTLAKLGDLKKLITDLNATFIESRIVDENKKQNAADANARILGCGPKGIGRTQW